VLCLVLTVCLNKPLTTLHSALLPCDFRFIFNIIWLYLFSLQCFDAVGWVTGRASGLYKLSDEVLLLLSVWSELQIVCVWSIWCHCHPKTPSSLAWFKSRLVLPFWYQVVLENKPLQGCSSSILLFWSLFFCCSFMQFIKLTISCYGYSVHFVLHSVMHFTCKQQPLDWYLCCALVVNRVLARPLLPSTLWAIFPKSLAVVQQCRYVCERMCYFYDSSAHPLVCWRHYAIDLSICLWGDSVAEWLECWTPVQKGPGSNCSLDAVR